VRPLLSLAFLEKHPVEVAFIELYTAKRMKAALMRKWNRGAQVCEIEKHCDVSLPMSAYPYIRIARGEL